MSVVFQCTDCGNLLRVREEHAGRRMRTKPLLLLALFGTLVTGQIQELVGGEPLTTVEDFRPLKATP